jgi:hypothetical protein
MTNSNAAMQVQQIRLAENVWHKTHATAFTDPLPVGGDDARAFLAAVLLGVEPKIRQARRFLMVVNAGKAALMPNHNSLSPYIAWSIKSKHTNGELGRQDWKNRNNQHVTLEMSALRQEKPAFKHLATKLL